MRKKPRQIVLKERLLTSLVKKEGMAKRGTREPLSESEKKLMDEYKLEIGRYAIDKFHPRSKKR
jgi:hypothetical protein